MRQFTLIEALKRFNRKERYWLICNALGPSTAQLGAGFRSELAERIGLEVPASAWWAMDYHIDWLVAALTLVAQGEQGYAPQQNDANLIKGNQEDVDLVVAFGDCLILIEAKGESAWCNEQFGEKVARMDGLRTLGLIPPSVKIFLVLMSPSEPKGIKPRDGECWQAWMCTPMGRPMYMSLNMPGDLLKVTRWDADRQKPSKAGTYWKVVPSRRPKR